MTTPALNDDHRCPICAEPLNDGDLCATDIDMGACHAACLEGSTIVDLETGEPSPGPLATFRYVRDDLASRLRRLALHDGHSSDAHVNLCATANEAATLLETLAADNAALRSALEPFSDLFDKVLGHPEGFPDADPVFKSKAGRSVTYGDFRRARTTLTGAR